MGLDHARVDLACAELVERIHMMDLGLVIVVDALLDLTRGAIGAAFSIYMCLQLLKVALNEVIGKGLATEK